MYIRLTSLDLYRHSGLTGFPGKIVWLGNECCEIILSINTLKKKYKRKNGKKERNEIVSLILFRDNIFV